MLLKKSAGYEIFPEHNISMMLRRKKKSKQNLIGKRYDAMIKHFTPLCTGRGLSVHYSCFFYVHTMSIWTNSKLNRNTKWTTQGSYWHFNCNFQHLTWLSILFRSARHVQFYDSNDCWQFLNSSFFLLSSWVMLVAAFFFRDSIHYASTCQFLCQR